MVKAYKNLLKEKEALEASVKALTSAAPAQPAAKPSDPLGVLGNSKHQDDQSQDAEGDKTEDKFVLEGQATVSFKRGQCSYVISCFVDGSQCFRQDLLLPFEDLLQSVLLYFIGHRSGYDGNTTTEGTVSYFNELPVNGCATEIIYGGKLPG